MSAKTIYVTQGHKRYVGGTITEVNGKNISGDNIVMAMGPMWPPPAKATAIAPDSDAQGPTTASRVVKKLIQTGAVMGEDQFCWAWITDNPEIEPIRLDGPINVV